MTLIKLWKVMRWTAFLLVAGICHVSATGRAQTVTYSAKSEPLTKVFSAIEHQTGYVFFYRKEDLQASQPVTVDLKQAALPDALTAILTGENLDFVIEGNTIVVKPRPVVAAPPGEIHGRVVDSTGAPLEGVNVVVKGTKKGTTTGVNGEFTIKNWDPTAKATLIVSNVGFDSREVEWKGQNNLRILLLQSQSSLDETVVRGYYKTTTRLNTGDVTTVKGETIQDQPVTDPMLALEGRVPGLYIQQASGIPGAYSRIHIMGQNSIANGNDPFYIIDGVPFSSTSLSVPGVASGVLGSPGNPTFNSAGGGVSPFNSLNPANIESIVVLKDADATAIYGSRGANGVILITTKNGKAGSTRVDLNAFTGGGQVTRMMHMLNTAQYLDMRRTAFENDGLALPSLNNNSKDNNYDIDGVWDTTRYTNWQKVLIGNTARFTNAQGSVSGGNPNTQFLVGGGYSTQGTPYLGNYYDDKIMGNASLTHTSINQRFHLQLGINYVYDNNNMPTLDQTAISLSLAPDAPALFDKSGNVNWQILNGTATFSNPVAQTLKYAKAASDNLISSLNLSYQLLPGLKLLSSFGYNHDEMHQVYYVPAISFAPPNNTIPSNRTLQLGTSTFEKWIVEPQLNYQQNIGLGKLEALAGATFEQNANNYFGVSANGFTSDALITDPLAASTVTIAADNNILYRYNAIYGRFGYDWNQKYLFNLTARRDGSSRFGPGKQFGNFAAGGIGWVFSRENFIQRDLSFLSYGKIRASYGITGNDQITDYQYLSSYSPTSNTTYEGLVGLSPTQLANPLFAWEVIKKMEGALELGFLKNKITFSMAYFRNRTGNQLVGYSLPYLTGFTSVQFNLPAIVQNEGMELTLSTINIKSKHFSWATDVNLTVPSNKLVAFPNIQNFSAYANTYVIGKSLFIAKVFHSTGVNPQTGLYSFGTKNASGLPSIPQEQMATKPITQKYYGGVDNKLSYKGFSLDIFVQFVNQLGTIWTSTSQPGAANQNEPTTVLNRWQSSGNLTGTQRFGTSGTTSTPFLYYQLSDAAIVNSSFVRLKNLSISYQLTGKWNASSHIKGARIYFQCQNLFTITRYLGMDPETGAYALPPLRMITAGVQFNFQ